MNKAELVKALSEKANVTGKNAETVLNAFIDVVGDTLKAGDKIQLVGFGTFEPKKREAHTARSPKTGETVKVPACTRPVFKAGKGLKDKVNG